MEIRLRVDDNKSRVFDLSSTEMMRENRRFVTWRDGQVYITLIKTKS